MDTRPQESFGVTHTQQIVEYDWQSGWQELDRRNDDATDGLIILRRSNKDTGDLVFAQIKCGSGYRQDSTTRPNHVGVRVGADYIQKHRPKWAAVPGPMIMIYIDPSNRASPEAYWTDLRNPKSFTDDNKSIVLLPKSQKFGAHSKGHIAALCKTGSVDRLLPTIKVSRSDINYLALSSSTKKAASRFYSAWKNEPSESRTNPALGAIDISRVGWRRMSRRRRRTERIIASWELLGVAKRIIQEVSNSSKLGGHRLIRSLDGRLDILDHLRLRARIVFPHRNEAIVQVTLRRKRSISMDGTTQIRHWLYSVHEIRRGATASFQPGFQQ
ncbi:DUF4365 domain-containing protein [Corallococcus coralloides]|uniref:DUF4365 domain-containing protein n=1 Tax=Corallococcus coralloides TaxID=184914 RepID=UPI00384BB453